MLGATVMVLTQIAMVAIMTMTPVHMRHHGHSLGEVGFVIGVHVGAMFLPSLVTGRLVDTLGRSTMTLVAGATLLAAGLVSAARTRGLPGLADARTRAAGARVELRPDQRYGAHRGRHPGPDPGQDAGLGRRPDRLRRRVRAARLSGLIVAGTSYATLSLAGDSSRSCSPGGRLGSHRRRPVRDRS